MKPTTLQTVLTSAIAIAFGCASPAQADLLLYEGFQTGANGYTADAALYGQTYRGFGEASGTWGAASGNTESAIVRAIGLKHVVASCGGRANYNASTGGGVILSPDRSAQGTFATAGLYDGVSGKMKMKMKLEARPDTPSLGEVQEAVRVLDATSPEEESARLEALAVVQKAARSFC